MSSNGCSLNAVVKHWLEALGGEITVGLLFSLRSALNPPHLLLLLLLLSELLLLLLSELLLLLLLLHRSELPLRWLLSSNWSELPGSLLLTSWSKCPPPLLLLLGYLWPLLTSLHWPENPLSLSHWSLLGGFAQLDLGWVGEDLVSPLSLTGSDACALSTSKTIRNS